jgi:hypothetical protein
MSALWLEKLKDHMPSRMQRAVANADKAFHEVALHAHQSHWHPISTAPCNQELEVRIPQANKLLPLEFPCLQTNSGQWINVDLGSGLNIQPVEWRVWQLRESPQPHHLKINPRDRSFLFHHDMVGTVPSDWNEDNWWGL